MLAELNLFDAKDALARVLIVDSCEDAALLRDMLAADGIRADIASDPDEAYELHSKNLYRLFLFGLSPESLGNELCSRVKVSSEGSVYFVVCSPSPLANFREHAFESGVDEFLQKPIKIEQLRWKLKVAQRVLSTADRIREQTEELEKAAERLANLNQDLTLASGRFAGLFQGLPMACFTIDTDGLVHEWNRAAEQAFGIDSSQTFLKHISELLNGEASPWTKRRVTQIFKDSAPKEFDWSFCSPGIPYRQFACNLLVFRDRDGCPVGAIAANIDVTGRKQAERRVQEMNLVLGRQKRALVESNVKLEHLATTDGLTGLRNHRRFQECLEELFQKAAKTRGPLSLILLDIDHFKSLNDAFGHQAGDRVLKRFAEILRARALAKEMTCRYGGEEFAIVLPGTGAERAALAAERFRADVEQAEWPLRQVTASFGVATLCTRTQSPQNLIAEADKALYASKQSGRNKVTHFDSLGVGSRKKAA